MTPIPLLIISDSPDQTTGLSRICRDLASLLTRLPQFRVGTFGHGGWGSAKLPFVQYNFDERRQWGEEILPRIWHDFAEDQKGVIFTIWDPSRLHWFSRPRQLPAYLMDFLTSRKFERWGYFPVDAMGPKKALSALGADTVRGYDRVLAYGMWGAEILEATLGSEVDWIPHGINLDLFQPRDKAASRMALGFQKKDLVLGCLMANTPRKDWGLAFAVIHELAKSHPNLKFWAHVDVLERDYAWNLHALIADYDLASRTRVTTYFSDEELSYAYSACDLTILPSLGEGFGYSIPESLACGVPVLHGHYGGGAELVPDKTFLVEPYTYRLDTLHNCVRPVYRPEDWVAQIEDLLSQEEITKAPVEHWRESVEHLSWPNLWPVWEKWFLKGLRSKIS